MRSGRVPQDKDRRSIFETGAFRFTGGLKVLVCLVVVLVIFGLAAATVDGISLGKSRKRDIAVRTPFSESGLLDRAEELLTRNCMRDHTFRYDVVNTDPLPEDRDFTYVVDDPVWAAKHGYGSDIWREADRIRRTDPNLRYLQSLSPQRQVEASNTLNGAGPTYVEARLPTGGTVRHYRDGCTAQAEDQLYGGFSRWYQAKKVTENLAAVRRNKVTSDPAFAAAVRKWQVCMANHGEAVATPDSARATLWHTDTSNGRAIEIRRAVTEANCALSSGLSAVAAELDRAAGRSVDAQYQRDVVTRAQMEDAALLRARAVVAEG